MARRPHELARRAATPFYFLKGGMNVSASALLRNLGILAPLFLGKMLPKLTVFIRLPAATAHRTRRSPRC